MRQTPMDDISRNRSGRSGSRFRLLEITTLQPESVDDRAGGAEKSPHHTESVKERAKMETGHRTHTAWENSQSTHADTRPISSSMAAQPTEGSPLEGASLELQGRMGNENVKSDNDTKRKSKAVGEKSTEDNGGRDVDSDQKG